MKVLIAGGDTNLLNWAVAARLGAGAGRPSRREDWNRLGRPDERPPGDPLEGMFPFLAGFLMCLVSPSQVERGVQVLALAGGEAKGGLLAPIPILGQPASGEEIVGVAA